MLSRNLWPPLREPLMKVISMARLIFVSKLCISIGYNNTCSSVVIDCDYLKHTEIGEDLNHQLVREIIDVRHDELAA